jgi:hypothetical protein
LLLTNVNLFTLAQGTIAALLAEVLVASQCFNLAAHHSALVQQVFDT